MSGASRGPDERVRIGELAARTGVSPRLLRYYESQGLIVAERSASGQRLFAETTVGVVQHVRLLLEAGLPTRVIRELLDCIRDPGRLDPCAVPILVEHLRVHDERIANLVSTRDTLQGLIDTSRPFSGVDSR
ncbi:MerR family transcriptional regulator [Occultella gossypii]|uniref:MerR family transcriptional regulator n=1 Tax=Occultella gossypii TaxID=2800820 RepID=A0ABS7S8H3_9MICO|nr:MerR family transcriptional regulator [Occultella gossypii]MBZ2195581.1 MerR family transcriptional regulator [Occultella gossypii]